MGPGTARYPAPAVHYPVGRSHRLAVLLVLLHLGSLAVLAAWLLQGAGAERTALLPSLLLWAVAMALSLRFWQRLPVGTLAWDGSGWQLHRPTGAPVDLALGKVVVVQVDLQHHMALTFPAARPAVWLLVERTREPARWLDLRRAVYSRPCAAEPAPAGTQPEWPSS